MKFPNNILHIYYSEWYDTILRSRSFLSSFLRSSKGCIIYLGSNLSYFISPGNNIISKKDLNEKIWLIVSTSNNINSLQFLNNDLEATEFVSTKTKTTSAIDPNVPRLAFHHSIFYLYRVLPILIYSIGKKGLRAFTILDKIFESAGIIEASKRILKKGKPKALIFANDHTIKIRGLIIAAKILNIPTIYLQHASVSESFPPLEFDLSLLEGQDAKNKYESIGPVNGIIRLIGMPRYDMHYESIKEDHGSVSNIGFCLNLEDDPKEISQVISEISQQFPDKNIIARPHPRDNRNFSIPDKVRLSDSKIENIFEFLNSCDAIIAGDTSSHLEAALLNIPSIYFKMSSKNTFDDYYGFVKNNLIPKAHNFKQLIDWVTELEADPRKIRKKAKYYVDTIDTEWDGKSSELAIKYIQEFMSKHS